METLFRKVFCNAIGQNKEHRNPTRHDYYATNVGTMRWTDHFGKDAWLDDGDEVSVQWWLEPIAPNRERAIETLRITIETYTQLRNPESNNLAAIFYDALINEGLLLGKSVNEEMIEIIHQIVIETLGETDGTEKTHGIDARNKLFELRFKQALRDALINEGLLLGKSDISLNSSRESEPTEKKPYYLHLDGTEKCFGYFRNEQGTYTIYYGTDDDIVSVVANKKMAKHTFNSLNNVLSLILNSSRESEPMTFEEFKKEYFEGSMLADTYIKMAYQYYLIGKNEK